MNKSIEKRVEALVYLGDWLHNLDRSELEAMYEQSYAQNQWFTPENTQLALLGIRDEFLQQDKLLTWLTKYDLAKEKESKKVGLVLAGNIPAVGFHDIVCVFASGHTSMIKFSEKDKVIIPFLLEIITTQYPEFSSAFQATDRLKDFDGVIATGSDNSSRYFNEYFGKYPHIIRKNRNSIAILDGQETAEELKALGHDVFSFFGLGCRNVSKVMLPENYDLTHLLEVLHDFNSIIHHHKYKSNFDYNIALFLLNKVKYLNNGCLILLEDKRYASRIASLHYEFYNGDADLKHTVQHDVDKIQCIVSRKKIDGIPTLPLGGAQTPGLSDYADGIDTLHWLSEI